MQADRSEKSQRTIGASPEKSDSNGVSNKIRHHPFELDFSPSPPPASIMQYFCFLAQIGIKSTAFRRKIYEMRYFGAEGEI